MIKYYELTEENRIFLTADTGRLVEQEDGTIIMEGEKFNFPDDFDFRKQSDYKIVDEELVYDPLPEPEDPEAGPSQLDIIEAQVTYTAMMTDTLLEV